MSLVINDNRSAPIKTNGEPEQPADPLILRAEIPHVGVRKAIRVQLHDTVGSLVKTLLDKLHYTDLGPIHNATQSPPVSADACPGQEAGFRLFRPASVDALCSPAMAAGTFVADGIEALGRVGYRGQCATDGASADQGHWMDNDCKLSDYGPWSHNDQVQLRVFPPPILRRKASRRNGAIKSSTSMDDVGAGDRHWDQQSSPSKSAPSSPRTSLNDDFFFSLTDSASLSSAAGRYNDDLSIVTGMRRYPTDEIPSPKKKSMSMRRLGKMVAQKTVSAMQAAPSTTAAVSGLLDHGSDFIKTSPHFGYGSGADAKRVAIKNSVDPKQRPSFGVSLTRVARHPVTDVPMVVEKLLAYLEENEIDTEGIFRLSGAASTVATLKQRLDAANLSGDTTVKLENFITRDLIVDGHSVAGVLKLYLRELPDPLLTRKLYPFWIAAQEINDRNRRAAIMFWLVQALPKPNRMLLRRLCQFFSRLATHTAHNKMTVQNFATVLGPNILRQSFESSSQMVHHASSINSCALDLIRMDRVVQGETLFDAVPEEKYRTPYICLAQALYDHHPTDHGGGSIALSGETPETVIVTNEMDFSVNDVFLIRSLSQLATDPNRTLPDKSNVAADTWWVAEKFTGRVGIVPSNYVKVMCALPFFDQVDEHEPNTDPISDDCSVAPAVTEALFVEADQSALIPTCPPRTAHSAARLESHTQTDAVPQTSAEVQTALWTSAVDVSEFKKLEEKVFILKKEKSQLLDTIRDLRTQLTTPATPPSPPPRHVKLSPSVVVDQLMVPPAEPQALTMAVAADFSAKPATTRIKPRTAMAARPASVILDALLADASKRNSWANVGRPQSPPDGHGMNSGGGHVGEVSVPLRRCVSHKVQSSSPRTSLFSSATPYLPSPPPDLVGIPPPPPALDDSQPVHAKELRDVLHAYKQHSDGASIAPVAAKFNFPPPPSFSPPRI